MINKATFSLIGFLALSLFILSFTQIDKESNDKYSIASPEYEELAEQALQHVEKYEFSELYKMVSDDIEYYMPDGGETSRTRYIGKEAFMGFWDGYKEKSGNDFIKMRNTVHFPLISHQEVNYTKVTGVIVISYFSMEMTFGEEKIDMRMNWGFHFNEDKKIDKIYSYYDRTPIINAAKRDILAKEDK